MFSRNHAPAASGVNRFSKPTNVFHTSKMFKNPAQRSTASRSKAAPLSKYALTSKPHGIMKSTSRRRRSPSPKDRERRQRQLDHPLSGQFIGERSPRPPGTPSPPPSSPLIHHPPETSESYRTNLINTAETALRSTRRGLLDRLAHTNGPTAGADRAPSPSNRLPTTTELQASHNAAIARTTAPFGSEAIPHNDDDDDDDDALVQPNPPTILAASMTDYAAVVAREEKKLKALGEEWAQVMAELRMFGEDIFGKEIVRGTMTGGKRAGVGRAGMGEVEVEALREAVAQLAAEGARECEAVEEAEKKAKKGQRRNLVQTFAVLMGDG